MPSRNTRHYPVPNLCETVVNTVVEPMGDMQPGDTIDAPKACPTAMFVHFHGGKRYIGAYDPARGGVVRVNE